MQGGMGGITRCFAVWCTAACLVSSMAMAPSAMAADESASNTTPDTSASTQAADTQCVAVSTSGNPDAFNLATNSDGTITVNGFADGFVQSSACYDLTIGENVSVIGENAFQRQAIHSLTFEGGDTVSTPLSIKSHAFANVTGLVELSLPARLQSGNDSMEDGEFSDIDSLESVTFSEKSEIVSLGSTSGQKLDSFSLDRALTTLSLPPKLTTLNNVFNNTSIRMDAVKWPTASSSLYIKGFDSTTITGTVTFPDNLKSITIEQSSFSGTLSGMVFPKMMDSLSIGRQAVSITCGQVVTVTLPQTVNSLSIGSEVFNDFSCPTDSGTNTKQPTQAKIYLPETVNNENQSLLGTTYGDNTYIVPDKVKNDSSYWERYVISPDTVIKDGSDNTVTITNPKRVLVYSQLAKDGEKTVAGTIRSDQDKAYKLIAPAAPTATPTPTEELIQSTTGFAYDPSYQYEFTFVRWDLERPTSKITVGDGGGVSYGQYYASPSGTLTTDTYGMYTWVAQWSVKIPFSISYAGLVNGENVPADAPTSYESNFASSQYFKFDLPKMQNPSGLTFAGWTWSNDYDFSRLDPSFANILDQTTPVTEWPTDTNSYVSLGTYGNTSFIAHYTPDQNVTVAVESASVSYTEGEEPKLPSTMTLTYSNGVTRSMPVSWDTTSIDWKTLKAGDTKTLTGTMPVIESVDGIAPNAAQLTVNVNEKPTPTPTPSPEPDPESEAKDMAVHRLYSGAKGEHFYTASTFEYETLVKLGWSDEGTPFTMSDTGAEVYRMYNRNSGRHIFTTSAYERDALVKAGWKSEGVAFHVPENGKTKVYRLYNQNNGDHLLTSSANERGKLLLSRWTDEKVAFTAK